MSAYDAANNGSAWFGGTPGAGAAVPEQADGYGFSTGLNVAAYGESGFDDSDVTGYHPGAAAYADPGAAGYAEPGATAYADPGATAHADPGPNGHRAYADHAPPAGPAGNGALLPAVADPAAPRFGAGPEPLRLVVVSAGLGQPSTARILADRLAEAARVRLGGQGRPLAVEVLELRDLALDIAGAMVAGFPGAKLRTALDAVEAADGLIAVSPIYTASYSGLFKSFFDVLDKEALTGKPTLIAATGGTARHSLALDHALRPMFAYLRAFIVPTAVFAASEDWASAGESSLNERIERAGSELGDLMAARPAAARRRRDEFEDVVPFEQRMAALRSGV